MTTYYLADVWDKNTITNKPPYTCKKAQPIQWETVQNAPVIEVVDARYRNAIISGRFVLSPFVKIPIPNTGKIDVLCRWFDHRLAKTGLTLMVDHSNVQFIPNFTGKVVKNIAK